MTNLATPKGFRDYFGSIALKRRLVVNKIVEVFERFGFEPLETPSLEYAQTLRGNYGEDEKLIYEFETKGGDQLALKYDQTVPLARVIAQHSEIPKPYKRYQIQSAFRGENPQRGRYREFLQCDADIVGVSSSLADTEILALCTEVYQKLGLEVVLKINDRTLLKDIESKYLAAIDKLLKIGEEGVIAELQTKGLTAGEAQKLLERIKNLSISQNLVEISELYQQMGYPAERLLFSPTLVRGLDYYTGLIFEVVPKENLSASSLAGGGRWDEMIEKFTGANFPAVGFSVGLDRTIELMDEKGLLAETLTASKVLVTVFNQDLVNTSLKTCQRLRAEGIPTEIWLDPQTKLDKQLKYADQKNIPYAVIIGPDEDSSGMITLKDLRKQTQQKLTKEELLRLLID